MKPSDSRPAPERGSPCTSHHRLGQRILTLIPQTVRHYPNQSPSLEYPGRGVETESHFARRRCSCDHRRTRASLVWQGDPDGARKPRTQLVFGREHRELARQDAADEIRQLDQDMRASLRKLGVRFGAYNIYVPILLKPAPSQLLAQLWALKHGAMDMKGLSELPQLSASGRTSIPVDNEIDKALYRVVGFRVCGPRAVRIDILERLADLIRPLIAWKPLDADVAPPDGAIETGGGFTVTVAMTSLLGCAGEDFSAVLKSLGYRVETKEVQRPAAPKPDEKPADAAPAEAGEAAAETTSDAPATEAEAEDEVAATDDAESASSSDAEEKQAPAELTAEESAAQETGTEATAETRDASATDATTPASDEPAAPETPEASDEAAPVEMETVTIEIWRPGRMDRKPRGRGHQDRRGEGRKGGQEHRQSKRHGGPKGKGVKPQRGGKPSDGGYGRREKQAPRDKPIDPDSPFAALMALKADMDTKGKK